MTILANSGPAGWVENLIAGPTLLVAIIFGVCGIFFRYRPAAIAGGVVTFGVAIFLLSSAWGMRKEDSRRMMPGVAVGFLAGIALIGFKRSPRGGPVSGEGAHKDETRR